MQVYLFFTLRRSLSSLVPLLSLSLSLSLSLPPLSLSLCFSLYFFHHLFSPFTFPGNSIFLLASTFSMSTCFVVCADIVLTYSTIIEVWQYFLGSLSSILNQTVFSTCPTRKLLLIMSIGQYRIWNLPVISQHWPLSRLDIKPWIASALLQQFPAP